MPLDGSWLVLTPLAGLRDPDAVAAHLSATNAVLRSHLVDLKRVSTDMVDGYLRASVKQVAIGAAFIALLLVIGLRSPARAWRVFAPSVAAIALTAAVLVGLGARLSVFHLVALLLVLGIGLNYALFIEAARSDPARRERVRQSLAVCVATTVLTFGILAFSATPVLRAIGSTVALGALLALLLAAVWTPAAPIPAKTA